MIPSEKPVPVQWSPALVALRRDMDKGITEWRYEAPRDVLA